MPTIHRTIVRPLITEKSSAAYQARGEYTFEVHTEATKPQIRAAIEQLFGVKVTGVWTANQHGKTGTITSVEYDPNRSARIALVTYEDGEKRYILHAKGLSVGDHITAGAGSDIRTGNALPLAEMPLGTAVHNIELKIGKGG